MDKEELNLSHSLFEDSLINIIPFFGPKIINRFPIIQYGSSIPIYGSLMILFFITTGFSVQKGILLGSTTIGIILWSFSFNRITDQYRNLKCPKNLKNGIRVYKRFYNVLISKYSLACTILFSLIGILYIISSNVIKNFLLAFNLSSESPFQQKGMFMFLCFVLLFAISIRVVSSGFAILAIFYRNYLFSDYIHKKNKGNLHLLPYIAITTAFDRTIFQSFFIFLFWLPIPLLLEDSILISLFIIIFIVAIFSLLINSIWLRRIRATSISKTVSQALRQEYHGFFASVSLANKPHITPILFGFDGVNLYFNTSIVSKKIKNLQHQNRVSLILKTEDGFHKIIYYGKSHVYGHNTFWTILYFMMFWPELFFAYKILQRKYREVLEYYQNKNLPLRWSPKPFIARTMIKIIPEKIVILPFEL
ncbi:MAG: pyridoxamine 5'-phosphate oxidase family protein [Candidatus Heimdallarchaeota archaeon]|nr:pyridoxamine 5'-phosphate oxidase family protein [Candidatus Heimdallarchaeota archaeon]